MTTEYEEILAALQRAARKADLGIKTYCLAYFNCQTVDDAITYIMARKELEREMLK